MEIGNRGVLIRQNWMWGKYISDLKMKSLEQMKQQISAGEEEGKEDGDGGDGEEGKKEEEDDAGAEGGDEAEEKPEEQLPQDNNSMPYVLLLAMIGFLLSGSVDWNSDMATS